MKCIDCTAARLKAAKRLYSIYCELGYIPWRKQDKVRKTGKKKESVYMGGRELIPFFNNDGKRTVTHLLLRPGYMMRDYVVRGDHENYLAPLTALLVFYSVFTLLLAIAQPETQKPLFSQENIDKMRHLTVEVDSTANGEISRDKVISLSGKVADVIVLTNLDLYPDEVDKPWKQSLAAFESNLRSKGVPMFLWGFLWMWFLLWTILRKYRISFSGSAAVSAYLMCQFCVIKLLVLLLTWGKSANIDVVIYALLLVVDYRQLLGVKYGKAVRLTLKTGFRYVWYLILLILVAIVFVSIATFLPISATV